MSTQTASSPTLYVKILLNSIKPVLMIIFMLTLSVTAFDLGYSGAGGFFGVIALFLGYILYKKIQSERVRAKFGEYRVNF